MRISNGRCGSLKAGYKDVYVPAVNLASRSTTLRIRTRGMGFIEFYLARANMIFARKHVPLKLWPFKMPFFVRLDDLPHSGVLIPPGLAKSRVLI